MLCRVCACAVDLIDFGDRNICVYKWNSLCWFIYLQTARGDEMAKQRKKKLKRSQDDDFERTRARAMSSIWLWSTRFHWCVCVVHTHVHWLKIAVRKLNLNGSQQRLVGLLAQFYRVRTGHFVPYPMRVIIPIADDCFVFLWCRIVL